MTAKKKFNDKSVTTEWSGPNSRVNTPAVYKATNAAEWAKLWALANGNTYPMPATPKMPKDKIAIGIFAGSSSAAVTVHMGSITKENGVTDVQYWIESRSTMLCVMSEAFLLKWIDKPEGELTVTAVAPPVKSARPKTPGL